MKWTRDHQYRLDSMSEPEDETPECSCGYLMDLDLLGDWVCAECDAKRKGQNENRQ